MTPGACGRGSAWDSHQEDNLEKPFGTPTLLIRVGPLFHPTERLQVHSLWKVHRFLGCTGSGKLKAEKIRENLEKHVESLLALFQRAGSWRWAMVCSGGKNVGQLHTSDSFCQMPSPWSTLRLVICNHGSSMCPALTHGLASCLP